VIDWVQRAMPHLIVAPIVLPLLTAGLMFVLGARRRSWQSAIGMVSTMASLVIAIGLLRWTDRDGAAGAIGVFLPAIWDVPFGIVLVVDRLSAMLLVLACLLAVCALVFARARWERAGVHFHTLFQIQLMGLAGAFLTADLFNLFVFFEVTLAASYGLLLHGSGLPRVRTGLRYIAMNLLASSFFLVGVAMIYGVAGTLNMADLARKVALIPEADRGLFHAGAAVLGVAFLVKAAAWPLNFWLVDAYAAAVPPVSAIFAILTKVGVYVLLRLWTLMLSAEASMHAVFAGDALVAGGLATLAMGAVGMLGVQHPRRLAGFAIVVSAGTLLAAMGFADAALIGGALFYLVVSTLAASALFLLAELVERSREAGREPVFEDDDELDPAAFYAQPYVSQRVGDLDEPPPVGRAIPVGMAFLGFSFAACGLLVAGLPPLSGFLGKLSMLAAILDLPDRMPSAAWTFFALLIASGFLSLLAFSRAGIRYFWAPRERPVPRLHMVETAPVAALLVATIVLTAFAQPMLRYARDAAGSLLAPSRYVESVMSATAK
jgi:multicomponent K+:H+ antiporter subunit D